MFSNNEEKSVPLFSAFFEVFTSGFYSLSNSIIILTVIIYYFSYSRNRVNHIYLNWPPQKQSSGNSFLFS